MKIEERNRRSISDTLIRRKSFYCFISDTFFCLRFVVFIFYYDMHLHLRITKRNVFFAIDNMNKYRTNIR